MTDDPHYVSTWQRYRRWRWIFLISWFGIFPYGLVVMGISAVFGIKSDWLMLLFVPWMLFFIIAGNAPRMTRCPRCDNPFFLKWGWARTPWRRSCSSCGLPIWSTRDPDEPGPSADAAK